MRINPVDGRAHPGLDRRLRADYLRHRRDHGRAGGDQRDFEFARKFGLEIIPVVQPDGQPMLDGATMTEAWAGAGVMINSGPFDGPGEQRREGAQESVHRRRD